MFRVFLSLSFTIVAYHLLLINQNYHVFAQESNMTDALIANMQSNETTTNETIPAPSNETCYDCNVTEIVVDTTSLFNGSGITLDSNEKIGIDTGALHQNLTELREELSNVSSKIDTVGSEEEKGLNHK